MSLGLTFNWGSLLGFTAITGELPPLCAIPLYAGGIAWTLVYDTIYAHQDKQDDVKVGVRSTALAFGDQSRGILTALSGASGTAWAIAGCMSAMGPAYFGGVLGATSHLIYQVQKLNFDDRHACGQTFKNCGWSGFILAFGLGVDYVLAVCDTPNRTDNGKVGHTASVDVVQEGMVSSQISQSL
jgi:4-hydroxybenzoate polyprenyltransferase